jgi:hypothetical protein
MPGLFTIFAPKQCRHNYESFVKAILEKQELAFSKTQQIPIGDIVQKLDLSADILNDAGWGDMGIACPYCSEKRCRDALAFEKIERRFATVLRRLERMAITMHGLCLGCCVSEGREDGAICAHLPDHGKRWSVSAL